MMQQGLNQTISPMSGLANGYVVSLYPMGAMLGAPVFGWAIEAFGLRATLAGLALTVLTCCAIAAMLWHRAQVPRVRQLIPVFATFALSPSI
jgi:MFS family permease